MGIVQRKQKIREQQRADILKTAMKILKEEGREAISLRKIADRIEYSAPMIYTHFKNKEALLIELCLLGYKKLNAAIDKELTHSSAEERLKSWLDIFLNFAKENKELYQLMYSLGIYFTNVPAKFPDVLIMLETLRRTISQLPGVKGRSEQIINWKPLEFLALAHGLVSTDFFWNIDPLTILVIQTEMVRGFIDSLRLKY